jgi:hypothetical protein
MVQEKIIGSLIPKDDKIKVRSEVVIGSWLVVLSQLVSTSCTLLLLFFLRG